MALTVVVDETGKLWVGKLPEIPLETPVLRVPSRTTIESLEIHKIPMRYVATFDETSFSGFGHDPICLGQVPQTSTEEIPRAGSIIRVFDGSPSGGRAQRGDRTRRGGVSANQGEHKWVLKMQAQ